MIPFTNAQGAIAWANWHADAFCTVLVKGQMPVMLTRIDKGTLNDQFIVIARLAS